MYSLDFTFESNVSQERAELLRVHLVQYTIDLVTLDLCPDNRFFLARCLAFAALHLDCAPMFLTVRRYVEGSSTCMCANFSVVDSLDAIFSGLRAVESYPGEIVDVGFETDQDVFWIHLNGSRHDV